MEQLPNIWQILVYSGAFGLAYMLCVSLINFMYAIFIEQKVQNLPELKKHPKVAILIPARNEADNLPNLLNSLSRLSYKNFSVTILDDNSTDNTKNICENFLKAHSNWKLISGKELPQGWRGKNWACAQLASTTDAEYLLFIDADSELSPNGIEISLGLAIKFGADLLSIFPQQKMLSPAEWISVPLLNYYLLSLLPLPLIRFSKLRQFATANGQFMLFTKAAYEKIGGHEALKSEIIEDNAFAKRLKNKNQKVLTIIDPFTTIVRTRMYSNLSDAILGFAKNFQNVLTNSTFIFLLFALYFFLINLSAVSILSIIALILVRIFVSLTSKQNPLLNVLLHTLQMLVFASISARAILFNLNLGKPLSWKGRSL